MMLKKFLLVAFTLAYVLSSAQDTANAFIEFEEFSSDTVVTSLSAAQTGSIHKSPGHNNSYWTLAILTATILAGILVRYKATRPLRPLVLMSSLLILGLYRGGCPCSIQSLQNGILLLTGTFVRWPSVLLFGGLLVVTYFLGRVYCGWICHLGALQEFIFKKSAFHFFQSARSQKIMRGIRMVALVILVSQLFITHTNLYKQIDPFAVIFNFYSEYLVGWILVFIVGAASLFLYRPFCKTLCPVGLVLGWVSRLPGASVMGVKQNCISCNKCSRECCINAITRDQKNAVLDNQECIRCGECITACPKDAFLFSWNNKKHRALLRLPKYPAPDAKA